MAIFWAGHHVRNQSSKAGQLVFAIILNILEYLRCPYNISLLTFFLSVKWNFSRALVS